MNDTVTRVCVNCVFFTNIMQLTLKFCFLVFQTMSFYFITSIAMRHGGADDMKSLLNTTFADYNKLVPPRRNYSRPIDVAINMNIPYIESLDVKNQLFKFIGVLNLIWTDEFLQWNPSDFGGIDNFVIPIKLIWTPNFLVVNSKSDPLNTEGDGQVVNVFSNGSVLYSPTSVMEVPCQVDISKFPYDSHRCGPMITPWLYDNTTVQLMASCEGAGIDQIEHSSQFSVTSLKPKKEVQNYRGRFYDSYTFSLQLTRRPAYMSMTILLPICLISMLEGVSFVLPPDEPEKLAISITTLLSFTVFLGVINENLPETSENISLLVAYITALQLLAFLVVIGNAVVYGMHQKNSRSVTKNVLVAAFPCRSGEGSTGLQKKDFTEEGSNNSVYVTGMHVMTSHSAGRMSSAHRLNTYLALIYFVLFFFITAVIVFLAVFT